jgi:hypothetical protein
MYAPIPAWDLEVFPTGRILVDDFIRAVRRMKGDEDGVAATAPDVVIINVSLGDARRLFVGRLSPWARALDWLAAHYGILFVVSAGNADDLTLDPSISSDVYVAGEADCRTRAALHCIKQTMRSRRLIAPAEASNALTVGALHDDEIASPMTLGSSLDPCPAGVLPTPLSRIGPGYLNAVKPEILMPGGRLRARLRVGDDLTSIILDGGTRMGGLAVASADSATGQTWSGATSGAAALATRSCHRIHDALERAYPDEFPSLSTHHRAAVLKALMIHRATINPDARELIEEIFGPPDPRLGAQRKANVLRLLGFGVPDVDEVIGCVDSRATLWGYGTVGQNEARAFRIPLPAALMGSRHVRRLSVSLAWLSPVSPGRRAYRAVRLTVEEPDTGLLGTQPTPGQADRRLSEKGTAFNRCWTGRRATEFAEGDALEVRVARKPDQRDDLPDTVAFGVAITIETDDLGVPIYDQVRQQLAIQPRVPVRL